MLLRLYDLSLLSIQSLRNMSLIQSLNDRNMHWRSRRYWLRMQRLKMLITLRSKRLRLSYSQSRLLRLISSLKRKRLPWNISKSNKLLSSKWRRHRCWQIQTNMYEEQLRTLTKELNWGITMLLTQLKRTSKTKKVLLMN